jgi:hypothetical protein
LKSCLNVGNNSLLSVFIWTWLIWYIIKSTVLY